MNTRIKEFAKKHPAILAQLYYMFGNNKTYGIRGNVFHKKNAFIKGLRLLFYGSNNEVIIGGDNPSLMKNCFFEIHGSHHRVIIEGGVGANNLIVYCADKDCIVRIKKDTQISGKTELAVMEGTKIEIGADCLFSANIALRTGDSHSVIDALTGKRVNVSKSIIVGDHVWIGNTVIITKGTTIGNNSIVATGSVVTGKVFPNNTAIAGNPAMVIKEGVSWLANKI